MEVDHTFLNHTFKIVTTKRTLVLCRGLARRKRYSGLRSCSALHPRRSDSGGSCQGDVPGDIGGRNPEGSISMLLLAAGFGSDRFRMKNRRETPPRILASSAAFGHVVSSGTVGPDCR